MENEYTLSARRVMTAAQARGAGGESHDHSPPCGDRDGDSRGRAGGDISLRDVDARPPLKALANPNHPPNPAKAAWYFLGVQELLLHMHPLAALVFLGLVLASIVATPWWDRTIDPGLLAGFPTLISNGLIPLLLSLGGLAIIYDGLLRILRANQSEALLALLELGAASLIYMKPRSLEGEFGGIVTDLTLTSTASIFSIFRGERNQVFCVATAGGTEIRKNLVSTPDY